MNTAEIVTGEPDRYLQPEEMPAKPADPVAEEDVLTRWLPSWMVTRIAPWNLPAPLALAVIAAALFGALITPFLAANDLLGLLIAGGLLGIAGVIVVAKWRILGLAALPVAALMIKFSIGTGSQTGINAGVMLLLLLVGLWLLDMIARRRQVRLLTYRPVIAALVFGVVAIIAFGFGQIPWYPTEAAPLTAQVGGLLIFLLSLAAFLLAAHQVRTVKMLEWLTWVFLGVGFLFFAFRLFPTSLTLIEQIFVRQGVLGASLYVWLVAIAFSQAIFNRQLARGWRAVLGLLVAMIFLVNMGSEDRAWISGWLPAMVTLIAIIVLARPDLGLFAITGGIIVLLLNTNIISSLTTEGDNIYSTVTRLAAWEIIAQIVKVNPIFGIGMANYYWYTPLFPIMGYSIKFNSHNNYVDIVAQTGLIGLACFLWLLAELWLLGWRMRSRVPDGFPNAYVLGVLGGLAGTIVAAGLGDWVIPFVYNIGLEGMRASMFIWIFLGGLVALANIYHFDGKSDEAQPG
jgi:O-antigen ligase